MYLVGINICMNCVLLGVRCFTRSTVGSEVPHWRFERVAANGVRQNTSAGWKTQSGALLAGMKAGRALASNKSLRKNKTKNILASSST